jgi:hypothetical protein
MNSKSNTRPRGKSYDNESSISLEDLTVMKLMEEVMEFDQEIKMKQKWMNARMNLLHRFLKNSEK